jgi:citrate lyase subunit beta/citryl-CoA lyase
LPKVESADEIYAVAEVLDEMEASGAAGSGIRLLPIVETARGVMNAFAIASASPRVISLALGLEDYTRDIGAERTREGRESWWALGQVVNAARAAGVAPLASVYADVSDEAGMSAWAREMHQMGFEGAGCLHPRQVRLANAAFTPTSEAVAQAERILAAFEQAQAAGSGVAAVDGQMVDAPVAARARRTLRLAVSLENL